MQTIQIDPIDLYTLQRAKYLCDHFQILGTYWERMGYLFPKHLNDAYIQAQQAMDIVLCQINLKVFETTECRYAWTIEMDTGIVYILDSIATKPEDIHFTYKNVEQFNDMVQKMFPDQIEHPVQTLTFYLTDACNLRCKYCYEPKRTTETLSLSDIDKFLKDVFDNAQQYEAIAIQFIGGEPLLHPELITYTVDKYFRLCYEYKRWDLAVFNSFTLTTNGTLTALPTVKSLRRNYPNVNVSISIDGCREAHNMNRVGTTGLGSYDAAVETLAYELKLNPETVPKMTYNAETIPYLFESLKSLHTLCVKHVTCTPALEYTYTVDDGLEYLHQLCKYVDYIVGNQLDDFAGQLITKECPNGIDVACGGQGLSRAVFPGGSIYTCARFAPMNCSHIAIDSVELHDYKTVPNKLCSVATEYVESCEGCPIKARCTHCAAIEFSQTGRLSKVKSTNGCTLYWAQALAGNYYNSLTNGNVWITKYNDDPHMLPHNLVFE